ncbi:MAG: hypothetical protein QXH30_02235 [Candidatus Bilamarchaeaceae archaeon]
MVTQKEIEEVIRWCEQVKKEKRVVAAVERNPFGGKIGWMGMFPLIEIDRPKEVAGKRNLVYDSTMRKLWRFMGSDWVEIIPDVE